MICGRCRLPRHVHSDAEHHIPFWTKMEFDLFVRPRRHVRRIRRDDASGDVRRIDKEAHFRIAACELLVRNEIKPVHLLAFRIHDPEWCAPFRADIRLLDKVRVYLERERRFYRIYVILSGMSCAHCQDRQHGEHYIFKFHSASSLPTRMNFILSVACSSISQPKERR